MTKKKKGSAFILTIAVISMLLILSISIISLTTSNRMTTLAYDNINELKMIAQTGANNGLSILKENIIDKIKGSGNSNSVLYDLAKLPDSSTVHELGLDPTISKNISGNNPQIFSAAFNVFSGTVTDDDVIHYGDCYVEYVDNAVVDKNTNEVVSQSNSNSEDLNSYLDPSNNINKKCIKMTVIAVGKNNSLRRVDVYIDKNSITDFYLDKMASNVLTVINQTTDVNQSDFKPTMDDSGNSYDIAGNIYFRGHSFNLNDSSKITIDGSINAKVSNVNNVNSNINFTPSKMTDINGTLDNSVSIPYNRSIPTSTRTFEVYQDGSVTTYSAINMPFYAPLDDGATYYNDPGILRQDDLISQNAYTLLTDSSTNQLNNIGVNGGASPYMVIARCKPNTNSSDDSVDFNKIVYGLYDNVYRPYNDDDKRPSTQNGLRYFIKNGEYEPDGSYGYNVSGNKIFNFNDDSDFTKLFKMIIVYGNLNINANTVNYDGLLEEGSGNYSQDNYRQITNVNYIIICLGKVTISGKLALENSSIFAKQITFLSYNNHDTILEQDQVDPSVYNVNANAPTATALIIHGIGTNKSIHAIKNDLNNYYDSLPNNAWGYLDNIERAKINEYLINNLPDQYAEGLKFKIINWSSN